MRPFGCHLGSAEVRSKSEEGGERHRALLVQGAADGAVQRGDDIVAEVAAQPARRRTRLCPFLRDTQRAVRYALPAPDDPLRGL